MRNLRYLETASATALMLSKYFLAISSVFGWWLSILGYVLTLILTIKIKLRIVAVAVGGLALLSTYGLYKWTYQIQGLHPIDFTIIILSTILAISIVIYEAKRKKPFWILQAITTTTFIFAFLMLGLKMEIGWYALLIGLINNTYLYYRKRAYVIGIAQIISIIIVLTKIL